MRHGKKSFFEKIKIIWLTSPTIISLTFPHSVFLYAQMSATLLGLGGLRVSVTLRTQLAGDLSPGKATQARKVKG